jgi:hypothetical protein
MQLQSPLQILSYLLYLLRIQIMLLLQLVQWTAVLLLCFAPS